MAINVKLEGDGIVPHLIKTRAMRQEAQRHFHFHSKLWRAIQEHILSKDCVLFERTGTVATYSAGPGIGLERFNIPFNLEREPQNMVFDIRVSYWADSESSDNRETRDEHYSVYFPATLESKFTKRKFNLWLEEKRKARDETRQVADIKTLQRLIEKYPGQAASMLPEGSYRVLVSPTLKPKSKSSSRTSRAR